MKKAILSIIIVTLSVISLKAQCVIVPSCTTSTNNGMCTYPLPQSVLTIAKPNMLYNDVIQFRMDTTTNNIPILGATITTITGLPNGINTSYNPINGAFPGGSHGCVALSGIPNAPLGTYTVFISLTVTISVNSFVTSTVVTQSWYLPVDTNNTVQPCQASASFSIVSDTANVGHYTAYDSSTGNGTLSYLWDFGDGITDNIPYPSHTYTTPGSYIVCLTVTTNTNGVSCSDSHCDSSSVFKIASGFVMSSLIVKPNTITGLKNMDDFSDYISIYPNPVNNELFIDLKQNKKMSYTLTDALGREILKGFLVEKSNRIDVSSLPKSYYQLTVVDIELQQLKVFKLVK